MRARQDAAALKLEGVAAEATAEGAAQEAEMLQVQHTALRAAAATAVGVAELETRAQEARETHWEACAQAEARRDAACALRAQVPLLLYYFL